MNEPWFDPDTFEAYFGVTVGILGAVVGTTIGILGAVVGSRGRGFVVLRATLLAVAVLGLLLLGVGLSALAVGQPYGIWYGLVLGGVIFSIVGGVQFVVTGRLRRRIEHRRMEADDLRRA